MTCMLIVGTILFALCWGTSIVSAGLIPHNIGMRIDKQRDESGNLLRTVVLPKESTNWEEFDNNYVLISDSNLKPSTTNESIKQKTVVLQDNSTRQAGNSTRHRRRKKKPDRTQNSGREKAGFGFFKDPKYCEDGGTCYHQSECDRMGGISATSCANGYGVCCQMETECGFSGPMNGEIFVGGSSAGVCTLGIQKQDCAQQMRFDFLKLEMDDPTDGACVSERLLITGQNMNSAAPVICGSNSGQHMYVDVDESKGPIMLTMISPEKKKFRIRVRQFCNGDPLLAPRNCLQYYTKPSGAIQSFNYKKTEDLTASYMNNLNYAICIRKAPGMCSIVYSNLTPDGEEFPFEMNNLDYDGALTVPPKEAGAEVFNCPDDYIVVANVRLCGQKLNDASVQLDFTKNYPITDVSGGPFNIHVVSDSVVSGRGFYMNYQQQSC